MFLLFALVACGGPKGVAEPEDTDTGADPEDTGTGDTDPPVEGDVEGPDLPDCTPQAGNGDTVALSGVILAPEGPLAGVVVYSRTSGAITCVGDCDTAGAEVVCTEGIVSPGLVDPHNHLQYNTLPVLDVEPDYDDRYEWQGDERYWRFSDAGDAVESHRCEAIKWAEARELIHGTTAAAGSYPSDCNHLLIRNLDEDETCSGLEDYYLDYNSGRITNYEDSDVTDILTDLASGWIDAEVNHVAEGRGGIARFEIDQMFELGLSGPGHVFVHASDASTIQLAQMAADGTGILWSPRSNLALYGTTTPIEIADRLGVPWAIGTDWTPSGSMAPTGELACAAQWLEGKGAPASDVVLWEKVTSDAARLLALDGVLGSLAPGYRADIAVYAWDRAPYRKIIRADAADTRLVVVDGQAIYGVATLVDPLATNPDWCETLDVCGEDHTLCLKAAESRDDAATLADVESILTTALAGATMEPGYEYAAELFPLFTCTDERDSCDLRQPTSGDDDGDGIADSGDVCPGYYDPLQWDEDGDGEGDVCDPCPLEPDVDVCVAAADDIDGDGVVTADDNCDDVSNANQDDGDGDGLGDVCDPCPDVANPGGDACPGTIAGIRAGDFMEDERVGITGVIVTAVRERHGFFVQDGTIAGLYVYDAGDNVVSVGDIVDVEGAYVEFYGMPELTYPGVVVTGSGPLPEPYVEDACDLATGGALAEAREAMLVRVEGVEVTDANPDDPDDYDEFEVGGCLRVDDFLWADLDQPELGTTYATLTGVLVFGFDNSKIAPRDSADMEE